jgi:hypothetical protein
MPSTELQAAEAVQIVRNLLSGEQGTHSWSNWSERGSVLFVELITIGTYARVVNNEPPLTAANLRQFALWSEEMINSWFHL